MQPTTLNALVSNAWEMTTKYSKDYEPTDHIDPASLTELQDILSNPISPVWSINDLPVYSISLEANETRDNTKREILYTIKDSKFFTI